METDYSVHFANIQRVIDNIPEPWKSELVDTATELQQQIQENSQHMREGLEVVVQDCNMPPIYPFHNKAYLCDDYEGIDRI